MIGNYDVQERLNLIPSDAQVSNGFQNYFNLPDCINTINLIGSDGEISLRIASTSIGSNEVAQLLFTNNALESFENMSYPLTSYDESRRDELHTIMENSSNLFHCPEEIPDFDYIEWSLIGNNLIEKRKQFREQIDLYKTYDNRHHLITKLLVEIIQYYLNEYLIQEEHFSQDEAKRLEFVFEKAIEEQNYLKYFIKAYTLTNNFYRVLNRHLALYILDYFDTSLYSSSPTKYRLINCLVHIVTLLVNHPDINKYTYRGITYRGLSMTENDFKNYTIGNHILNRAFVSTSKDRSIAELFAGNGTQTSAQISVLLKYTTKQNKTAIDIEPLSTIQDEEEVLILPFSVFQVKDRIENSSNMSSPALYEIDLEECEDDEETNNTKNKISKPGFIPLRGSASDIPLNARWQQNGLTVAGGNRKGNRNNQLSNPCGLYVDDDQTVYVADRLNHRIVEWKSGATSGQVVAGGNGQGSEVHQLSYPTDVIVDKGTDSLIICDASNKRVVRWPRRNGTSGETIISNINCMGLTMDEN
ncbi:unnamed protein product [Rotaria magnacalcarata]|uniref:NAD(P)(+)--arginine ADP-ribosyltransferase n=2 Tax=Rotaria magnacalcarata TaxID=392030 RepID=A0A816MKK7_9BILA|nr:unnamed protein product [Rotaria magnacalcarata]